MTFRARFLLLLACLWAGPLFAAQEKPDAAEEKAGEQTQFLELTKKLVSEDFSERRQATAELWALGEKAVKWIENLEVDADPELRLRAKEVGRKIELGLSPDTPAEVLTSMGIYFRSGPAGKQNIIRRLKELRQFDLLLRLRKIETNQETLADLNRTIGRALPYLMYAAHQEGKHDRVRELLETYDHFDALVRMGGWLKHRGELDAEIRRLEGSKNGEDVRRYLAYLRVAGDAQRLRSEARRLGDHKTELTAALALGDIDSVLEHWQGQLRPGHKDYNYLQWLQAHRAGHADVAQEKLNQFAAKLVPRESRLRASGNLYRTNGFGIIPEVLPEQKEDRDGVFRRLREFYETTERPLERFELLGLSPEGPDEEWFETSQEMLAEDLDRDGHRPRVRRALEAADLYSIHRQDDVSARIFGMYFDVLRESRESNLISFLATKTAEDLNTHSPGFLKALAREVDEHGGNLEDLAAELYSDKQLVSWLLGEIKLLSPPDGLSTYRQLLVLEAFLGRCFLPKDEFAGYYREIEQRALVEYREQGDSFSLTELIQANSTSAGGGYPFRDRGKNTLKLLEEWGEPANIKEQELVRLRARYAFLLDDFKQANLVYQHIAASRPEPAIKVERSFVLDALNEKEVAKELREEGYMEGLLLGNWSAYAPTMLSEKAYLAGDLELAFDEVQAVWLLFEDPLELESLEGYGRIAETSVQLALLQRDWKRVNAFSEFAAMAGGISESQLSVRHRLRADLAFAMLLVEEKGERERALEILRTIHAASPASGALADDFFPALREAGLTELHDALVEKSLAEVRKVTRTFPKDANQRNTFAWIASRANRQLAEAEAMVAEALKQEPRSHAYLDTMAEVHFAKRDRETAVKWSTQAIELRTSDPALLAQHRRFQRGKFPVK